MPRATLRFHVGHGLALTNFSEPGSGFTAPEPIIVRGRRHKAIPDRRGEASIPGAADAKFITARTRVFKKLLSIYHGKSRLAKGKPRRKSVRNAVDMVFWDTE